jgi:hypothetical protein
VADAEPGPGEVGAAVTDSPAVDTIGSLPSGEPAAWTPKTTVATRLAALTTKLGIAASSRGGSPAVAEFFADLRAACARNEAS